MNEGYRWEGDNLLLRIRVQPRSSRDQVEGWHGGALKIRLTAPPVDGRANERLIEMLAQEFGVAKRQVELISGESGRDKRARILAPATLPPYIQLKK
jgi:uncharacterized protein (TIGR00251 family)